VGFYTQNEDTITITYRANRKLILSGIPSPEFVGYAQHVADPDLSGGVSLSALRHVDELMSSRSRPKGLWGESPLYVNPVNVVNTLTKVSRFVYAGNGIVRNGMKEAPLSGMKGRTQRRKGASMSPHDTKNPNGGVNMGHVMELPVPNDDPQLFKEL